MSRMTDAEIAESRRAEDRARAVLKPGYRLYIAGCGGSRSTVTLTGWDGRWITSANRCDIHALHIIKVNGVATSFRDGGAPYPF